MDCNVGFFFFMIIHFLLSLLFLKHFKKDNSNFSHREVIRHQDIASCIRLCITVLFIRTKIRQVWWHMPVISPWEAKQGGSQVPGLPNLHSETLSEDQPNLRPCQWKATQIWTLRNLWNKLCSSHILHYTALKHDAVTFNIFLCVCKCGMLGIEPKVCYLLGKLWALVQGYINTTELYFEAPFPFYFKTDSH